MNENETVTRGPASHGSYRYSGPELASEPELTAHARVCEEWDENNRRHCGGSVWCDYCKSFCYGGVVLNACRECRQRWAQFPEVISRAWMAKVRQHAGFEVEIRRQEEPMPTSGARLATELRRYFSIGTRTMRYRRRDSGRQDLHADMIEAIMIAAQFPGVYTERMTGLLHPGFGAALAYGKHVGGYRIDGTLHRHITELSAWQFAALLGQMVDAGVTNTGEGERFFTEYGRRIAAAINH